MKLQICTKKHKLEETLDKLVKNSLIVSTTLGMLLSISISFPFMQFQCSSVMFLSDFSFFFFFHTSFLCNWGMNFQWIMAYQNKLPNAVWDIDLQRPPSSLHLSTYYLSYLPGSERLTFSNKAPQKGGQIPWNASKTHIQRSVIAKERAL